MGTAIGNGFRLHTVSAAGLLTHPHSATYAATKHAALAFAEWLSIAYGDRGITLTILGRFADAIPDFTRVIETYPQLAYAHYNRGICYELLGLDDLAIEDISRSIELEPRAGQVVA